MFIRLLSLLVLMCAVLGTAACQERIVRRRGIGDPNLGQPQRIKLPPDTVRDKYDDGGTER